MKYKINDKSKVQVSDGQHPHRKEELLVTDCSLLSQSSCPQAAPSASSVVPGTAAFAASAVLAAAVSSPWETGRCLAWGHCSVLQRSSELGGVGRGVEVWPPGEDSGRAARRTLYPAECTISASSRGSPTEESLT